MDRIGDFIFNLVGVVLILALTLIAILLVFLIALLAGYVMTHLQLTPS